MNWASSKFKFCSSKDDVNERKDKPQAWRKYLQNTCLTRIYTQNTINNNKTNTPINISKTSEMMLYRKRYRDGKKAHENISNILSHQGI